MKTIRSVPARVILNVAAIALLVSLEACDTHQRMLQPNPPPDTTKFDSLDSALQRPGSVVTLHVYHDTSRTFPATLKPFPNLYYLWWYDGNLDSISSLIGELHLLEARFEHNHIRTISAAIGKDSILSDLDLADNELKSLPEQICDLTNLWQLDVAHNPLTKFPVNMQKLQNLSILYIYGCPIGLDEIDRIKRLLPKAWISGT